MELCVIPSHSAVPSLCLRRSLGDDAGRRKVFRPVLFNRNIMWNVHVISHFLAATWVKRKHTGEINFDNMLFNPVDLKYYHFNMGPKYHAWEILHSFITLSPWNLVCILHLTQAHLDSAIFQVLSSYRWIASTELDIPALSSVRNSQDKAIGISPLGSVCSG